MKKLPKFLVFIGAFNIIYTLAVASYVSGSAILPAFKDTDIEVMDILKPHLSQDKYEKLEKNLNICVEKSSSEFAKNLKKSFTVLVPSPNFDYSKVPAPIYPYEDPTPIINKAAKKGFQEGLNIIKQMDRDTEIVKTNSLSQ